METIDLGTGHVLAAFPDYRTAKEFADKAKTRVCYCGKLEWVRAMEAKRWPKKVPGLGYRDYRYTEEAYRVRHQGLKPPPTFDGPMESIRAAAELLAQRQGFALECIVVVKRR